MCDSATIHKKTAEINPPSNSILFSPHCAELPPQGKSLISRGSAYAAHSGQSAFPCRASPWQLAVVCFARQERLCLRRFAPRQKQCQKRKHLCAIRPQFIKKTAEVNPPSNSILFSPHCAELPAQDKSLISRGSAYAAHSGQSAFP